MDDDQVVLQHKVVLGREWDMTWSQDSLGTGGRARII